ncbi:methylthioribulose 1-phosphate dehydratase [Leptospira levettii]|uniref:Methylthioribulose-1-phosphate dehydratase n=1 Tax=Leptospira levettii TaxID=2023178 RepID=A0AAW5VF41_9LEPT|nr:methylthioribulose 1-phosphate dehydratase [Leptospira levettii]MCW7467279.1 methylthioribulose 1-phosphate dehydratase [Leptospira levettii]MCW7513001.1 methylthioribulose 1-phosphate dehydratase [Leptospira levettii]MCW7516865.1 methylthioribulose 1-phosphate dehydratase [Leptospira levettii]
MDLITSLQEITKLSHLYYSRQWMFATAGNLSTRDNLTHNQFWITASGKHKGELRESDFVCVSTLDGSLVQANDGLKPSAETSIHQVLYSQMPEVGSCLHVHTIDSNLLEFGVGKEEGFKEIPLPPIEIIKAFGIWDEKPNLTMPVFYNHTHVPTIANEIKQYLMNHGIPKVPFLLIEGHGPTVWGKSIAEANKHLEAVHFLLQVMARRI